MSQGAYIPNDEEDVPPSALVTRYREQSEAYDAALREDERVEHEKRCAEALPHPHSVRHGLPADRP